MIRVLAWITLLLILLVLGAFIFYVYQAIPAYLDARDGEVIAHGNCAYTDKSELATDCVEGQFELYQIAIQPSYVSPEFGCVLPRRYIICEE